MTSHDLWEEIERNGLDVKFALRRLCITSSAHTVGEMLSVTDTLTEMLEWHYERLFEEREKERLRLARKDVQSAMARQFEAAKQRAGGK